MDFLSHLCPCLEKRLKGGRTGSHDVDAADDDDDDTENLLFELRTLEIATNSFSEDNLLGRGGFGPVYKGSMPNGQEVAVKRLLLSEPPGQGLREFTNEVKFLLRIQHRNLVTLLGCCIEESEKMLVYEYLPNKSLDNFLFDKVRSATLDWTTRFRIVNGVARGLLYLHEDAPEKIIHRDIKASNILLDEQLNPKISDFGLARLFSGENTHATTSLLCGTPGYMAPEYCFSGYLSPKADVFSYGVLVLEIVSGRKNFDISLGAEKAGLLNYAWTLYKEGKSLDLIDPTLEKCNHNEAAMCIQLGLLCCQESTTDRPDMNSVHFMLSSDSFTLPRPGKPGTKGGKGCSTNASMPPLANTNNTSSASAGVIQVSGGKSFAEDYSRNCISYSSIFEGR
ncbi:hypothetical protein SLEP1_g33275 [Rubroshorea leprosula]|uniref:Protein kinase domain-containing protein n=1 Tax=Rubroshorea leprosula TaxID=152421 RepID=A0AAV5KG94_9ROSI|nr:hypothetical protein SLEP1_g33275 [Rubroshorea leprosula]